MKMKILLADDHPLYREGFRKILEKFSFAGEILEARDGETTVKIAKEHNPDLIFMDIEMPKINGIEATRIIHREFPEIKIIMLTVYARSRLVEESFSAGASGYLTKKSVHKELPKAMDAIMKGKRYVSNEISESQVNEL